MKKEGGWTLYDNAMVCRELREKLIINAWVKSSKVGVWRI